MTNVSKDFICVITTTIDFKIKLGSISASVLQGGGGVIFIISNRVLQHLSLSIVFCFVDTEATTEKKPETRCVSIKT